MGSQDTYELYGRDPKADEVSIYDQWLEWVHPDDRSKLRKAVADAFEKRSLECKSEFRFVSASGEVRWVDGLGTVEYAEDGSPLRMSGISLDITERKRAEEGFREAEKSERQKREELETILAALPAAVMIAKDPDCLDIAGNPAAYELLQLPRGTNISKSVPSERSPKNYDLYQNGRRRASRLAAQKGSGEEVFLRGRAGDSVS